MDIKELRAQDMDKLDDTLTQLLKQHFELRMQHKSAQLSDSSKLGKVRRSIAQVKTIIIEKQT